MALEAFSVEVLAFLLVDVMEHAFGIAEHFGRWLQGRERGIGLPVALTLALGAGFVAGGAGLAILVDRSSSSRTVDRSPGG